MKFQGIVLVFIIVLINNFEVCRSECNEYVLFLKTKSCFGRYFRQPIAITETPCTTADIYDEINGCERSLLELDCAGRKTTCELHYNITNNSTHEFLPSYDTNPKYKFRTKEALTEISTTELTAIEPSVTDPPSTDKSVTVPSYIGVKELDEKNYNVNLIYIYEDNIHNLSKSNDNKTKIQLVQCDYAEFSCPDKSKENCSIINHGDIRESLRLTLKRNYTSEIQPIFTGYTSHSKPIDSPFKDLKMVTLTCGFKNSFKCEEENLFECNLNVYLKSNYIQNNTKSVYTNCKHYIKNKAHVSVNTECDGFQSQHKVIAPPKLNDTDLNFKNLSYPEASNTKSESKLSLVWRCQKLHPNNPVNLNNSIFLQNCTKIQNISDAKEAGINAITVIVKNTEVIDANIITENPLISEQKISDTEVENDPKNQNVTGNRSNCSDTVLRMAEGKIIDLDLEYNNKSILASNTIKLNILNCINDTHFMSNSTQNHNKTNLVIILKNDTLNNIDFENINEIPEDTLDKNYHYLHCTDLESNNLENADKNKSELECKWIHLDEIESVYKATTPKDTLKELLNKDDRNGTQTETILNENSLSNETEDDVTEKNTVTEKPDWIFKSKSKKDSEKKIITAERPDSLTGANIKTKPGNETSRKSVVAGQNRETEEDGVEKIILIVIASVAGVSLLLIVTLRKFTKKGEYNPTPTREGPDQEDTAL